MTTPGPITGLVLDFGEVLVRPQSESSLQHMAQLAGLDVDELTRRYWRHRREYDTGELSGTAYWRHVLAVDNTSAAQDATIESLKVADWKSWTDYREEIWELAARFKKKHGRTALLSNGVPEVMTRVRAERDLSAYFDAVVISYEVGCAKPDARIYQHCLTALGVVPESALFVDDRRENLDTAAQLGMNVFHFIGEESVVVLQSVLAERTVGRNL